MENTGFDFWMFIAGLGIFLFGMRHLEDSIKALAGKSFKNLLQRFTKRSWKGILTGTAVTAILQSSTMVTLLALAFLGGGMIGLKNAVSIVLGANLGTTFTAWIVATFGFKLDIADFSFPFLAVGILSYLFLDTRPILRNLGGLLVGFGLLFLGLDYMKVAIETVAGQIDLATFSGYGLWAFVLIGVIITALIQSSSAMIVIILSALNADLIDIYQSVAMVIGANIGTTTTLIFISIGGTADTKRLMMAHVIFNVVTGTLMFFFIKPLVYVTYYIFGVEDPLMELVLLNTVLNATGILLFYPFLGFFGRFLKRRFVSATPEGETLYVKNISPKVADVALQALDKEIAEVYRITAEYIKQNFGINERDRNKESRWKKIFASASGLSKKYEKIKRIEDELTTYYAELHKENLTPHEAGQLTAIMMGLRSLIYSAKDIKDVTHNILYMLEAEDPLATKILDNLREVVYHRLEEIQQVLELEEVGEHPPSWVQENEQVYNELISELYNNIKGHSRKGVPISTITNVIKQGISSLDNLCSAIIYWKFRKVTTLDEETLPGVEEKVE
ncbi:Na/Pi cotransporter family protein [Antarcticibacterium flavum]|uniref:Na/Pi cotransporter family protein n=1 Tax=Antarcticibacterium flavum TaxID=2058175 RepID=A0A5B7X1W4_9FLAO|nr:MULTISPECIES: Na/Pi symporter [Antarcticibacterium]MCM4161111.1 sodium:phosphate symporter [Antarcticibacterium sp. W02-3]QCY69387.1 Na/Pi cotransporter family protein [Antarcticibacterium flavum]